MLIPLRWLLYELASPETLGGGITGPPIGKRRRKTLSGPIRTSVGERNEAFERLEAEQRERLAREQAPILARELHELAKKKSFEKLQAGIAAKQKLEELMLQRNQEALLLILLSESL